MIMWRMLNFEQGNFVELIGARCYHGMRNYFVRRESVCAIEYNRKNFYSHFCIMTIGRENYFSVDVDK